MGTRISSWQHVVVLGTGLSLLAGLYALVFNAPTLGLLLWLLGAMVVSLWLLWGRLEASRYGLTDWMQLGGARRMRRSDKPLISLVLLLRRSRRLDEHMLEWLSAGAWGIELGNPDEAESFVAGAMPSFIIKASQRRFLVNSFSTPYFRDLRSAAARLDDARLKQLVSAHRAWISVDLLGDHEQDVPEAYRWIGRLIAELAEDDALAIVSPQLGRVAAYRPQMQNELRGSNPLAVFRRAGESGREHAALDARMRRAIEEARRQWPLFVQAFEERGEGQHFSVRVPQEEKPEAQWVTVTAIEHGTVYGRLENERAGRAWVRVKAEDVQDWMYTEGSGMRGGFTIEADKRTH